MQNNQSQLWTKRYADAGFSFFNTGTREKKCLTKWTEFQKRKPTPDEMRRFINYPIQNWAIVCGSVSNLVVFDVDTKNGGDPTPFLNRGLYEVRTPSGGYHFYTTYDPLLKSTLHKKNHHKKILQAVDVQSNGAIVFAPPSAFPNKQGVITPYTVVNDVPITPLPSDLMAEVLEALEPEKEATTYTPYTGTKNPLMGRPGDIFNALAAWEDILLPLGWTKVGRSQSGIQYWRRPGKTDGVSASTNWNNYNLFFPYTTHYSELDPKKGYTKFNLYATLYHGGNYGAAAKALVIENYKLAMNIR